MINILYWNAGIRTEEDRHSIRGENVRQKIIELILSLIHISGKHCENGFLTADEPRYPHTDQWNPWYGGYMPLLYRKSEKTGGVPR